MEQRSLFIVGAVTGGCPHECDMSPHDVHMMWSLTPHESRHRPYTCSLQKLVQNGSQIKIENMKL